MGKTSSTAKYKYNQKTYKAFNVQLRPELFNRIDQYCKEQSISRAQFLARAIDMLSPAQTDPQPNGQKKTPL